MSEPEAFRPGFHFTARKGWINDPNGLVYYKGEYHLFFQHNPESTENRNMHWGHAVSRDLVRWQELPVALAPDAAGAIWSGSAVVDWANSSGFKSGAEAPLVALYTSAGDQVQPPQPFTIGAACSNDRGRTMKKFEGNPVLGNVRGANRDPKVTWHPASGKWVMALYLEGNDFALFGSTDLRKWEHLCDVSLPNGEECPDFFELPVEDGGGETKWVFWSASTVHAIGSFDGRKFTIEQGPLRSGVGADYAGQTFSDVPESQGRRIQISWLRGGHYPGMPFNQQLGFPLEIKLKKLAKGIRLIRTPVKEIGKLYRKTHRWKNLALKPDRYVAPRTTCEMFDVCLDVEMSADAALGVRIRGQELGYDATKKLLTFPGKGVPVPLDAGLLSLRLLIDRTSLEAFVGEGRASLTSCFLPEPAKNNLDFRLKAGSARIRQLLVRELKPVQ